MHRLVRLLGAEVSTPWSEIPVEQVPVDGRPGVVEHPLDHARRDPFVAAIRLEHRALALIGHQLRRDRVILGGRRSTVANGQRGIEAIE